MTLKLLLNLKTENKLTWYIRPFMIIYLHPTIVFNTINYMLFVYENCCSGTERWHKLRQYSYSES